MILEYIPPYHWYENQSQIALASTCKYFYNLIRPNLFYNIKLNPRFVVSSFAEYPESLVSSFDTFTILGFRDFETPTLNKLLKQNPTLRTYIREVDITLKVSEWVDMLPLFESNILHTRYWREFLETISLLSHVRVLRLYTDQMDHVRLPAESLLAHLRCLPNLEALHFKANHRISAIHLTSQLQSFRSLKSFHLDGSFSRPAVDQGIDSLSPQELSSNVQLAGLQHLAINGDYIPMDWIAVLPRLPKLRSIEWNIYQHDKLDATVSIQTQLAPFKSVLQELRINSTIDLVFGHKALTLNFQLAGFSTLRKLILKDVLFDMTTVKGNDLYDALFSGSLETLVWEYLPFHYELRPLPVNMISMLKNALLRSDRIRCVKLNFVVDARYKDGVKSNTIKQANRKFQLSQKEMYNLRAELERRGVHCLCRLRRLCVDVDGWREFSSSEFTIL